MGKWSTCSPFESDNPSSNPTDAYRFSIKFVVEKNKNKQKKRPGFAHLKKFELRECRGHRYIHITARFALVRKIDTQASWNVCFKLLVFLGFLICNRRQSRK